MISLCSKILDYRISYAQIRIFEMVLTIYFSAVNVWSSNRSMSVKTLSAIRFDKIQIQDSRFKIQVSDSRYSIRLVSLTIEYRGTKWTLQTQTMSTIARQSMKV